MLMHRLNLTGVVAVLVLAVAATVLAVRKPSEADRSLRDDRAANVEARLEVNDEVIVAGGATSCELLGGAFQFFSFASIYRGNEVRFEGEATLLSFCMELSFVGTTDLYFSIHRRISENSIERLAGVPDVILQDEVGTGEAQFYCTDQADVPPGPILLRPADYVFGVAWGNRTSVTFFRDSLFDPSFIVGRVEGAIGLNGISPPLEDPLFLQPADNRVAHSMEICLAPEPGACCSALDGGCVSVLEEDCIADGAFFHGQRTSCNETPCVFGRCCFRCGQCKAGYTQEACFGEGGVAYGPGDLDCPAVPEDLCPKITGACCDSGGNCTLTCADLCAGTYGGDGTTCEPNPCKGACCVSLGCIDTTEARCTAFGGLFKDVQTTCATLPPEKECGGACCFGFTGLDDCEIVQRREFCTFKKGGFPEIIYRGDGEPCPTFDDGDDCSAPPGEPYAACCLPDGLCINTTQAFCEASWVNGKYDPSQDGQMCVGSTCSLGACCFADGECQVLTDDGCTSHPDIISWIKEGACDPNACRQPEGACCFTDASCQPDLTRDGCTDSRGIYQGDDTSCDGTCIALGACCRSDGTCFDGVTDAACMILTGRAFEGSDSTCDVDACVDERGTCCTATGSCFLLSQDLCELDPPEGIGGFFENQGDTCPLGNRCFTGACCLPDGRCEQRIEDACLVGDGMIFQGDNTLCDNDLCGACCRADASCDPTVSSNCNDPLDSFIPATTCGSPNAVCEERGACCRTNGTCDLVGITECDDPQDEFAQAVTCGAIETPCEPVGACCFGDGSCEDLRPADCLDALGVPQPTPSACAAGRCTTGACCSPEQECEDDAFRLSCLNLGHTFHVGETCGLDLPCDVEGACCVGEQCSVVLGSECELMNGVFNADLPDCTGFPPCADGACCQEILPDVFACRNEFLRLQCAGATDIFHEGANCDLDRPCDPTGACCVDGACTEDQAQGLCENANGRFAGLDTTCADGVCTTGACCLLSGTCLQDEPAFACTGDNQFTAGSTCAELDPSCERETPCCFMDESCDLERPADCVALGGAPQIGPADCTTGLCATGACCVIGTCTDDQTQTLCDNALGRFAGPDTTCADGVCTQGACCLVDGVCLRDEPAFACTGDNLFTAGSTCEELDPSCEAVTPCCFMDESCDLERPADCVAASGIPQTGAAECTTGLCATGTCCVDGACTDDQTQTLCENANGRFRGEGSQCDVSCGACGPDQILSSDPQNCAIDARFPHEPNDPESRFGFNGVELTFDCDPAILTIDDFVVTVHPPGPVVTITDVVPIDSTRVWLPFSEPTLPMHWTCVEYINSGEQTCLGSLPGDVDGNGAATIEDLVLLVDFFGAVAGAPSLDPWQCDIDRSTSCHQPDILAEIDLLLGVGAFDLWEGVSLPTCPSAP